MTPFRKNKNGLDNHKTLVESMMKQGAKFRRTLKYGFPVVARKTIFEGENENEGTTRQNTTLKKTDMSPGNNTDRMNKTATMALGTSHQNSTDRTPFGGLTDRSKNKSTSPKAGMKADGSFK